MLFLETTEFIRCVVHTKGWFLGLMAVLVSVLFLVGGNEKQIEETVSAAESEQIEVPEAYTRALEKTEIYFSWEDTSSKEVRRLLQAEGFSQTPIDYAIATVDSDYGGKTKGAEQVEIPQRYDDALQKTENYISLAGVSPTGLRKQLRSEGFSQDAIDYALVSADADYNEQAVKKAECLNDCFSMSDRELMNQLSSKGFTQGQAKHAVENLK